MDDKELLELAAKAAGITLHEHRSELYAYPPDDMTFGKPWNPLDSDGDALRLASHLQLDIAWFVNLQYVTVERRGFGENIGWVDDDGRSGALRRAITVVAAQIGKTL